MKDAWFGWAEWGLILAGLGWCAWSTRRGLAAAHRERKAERAEQAELHERYERDDARRPIGRHNPHQRYHLPEPGEVVIPPPPSPCPLAQDHGCRRRRSYRR